MFLLGLRPGGPLAIPRWRWWALGSATTFLALFFSVLSLTFEERRVTAAAGSGLFVFGSTTGAAFSSPHSSGGNYLVKWSSLEPSNGSYSWTSLDAALGRAQAAGKKLILRVYSNWSVYGQGTPEWFFDVSGARSYYPADTAQIRGYESPVPWDSVFQAEFGAFVQALGERYNGHSALEFVQITGIGVYGEIYLGQIKPADFTASKHLGASKYWIDTWREAFPDTELALMVNGIGSNIGENAATHAVSRGYYLQSNSHKNTIATRAIIAAHDEDTKIAIEAENGGCRTATVAKGFEGQMVETFSLGYEIDYLMICYESLTDAPTAALLPWVSSQLRDSTGSPASTATPFVHATATRTPTPVPQATATRTPTPVPQATATRTPTPTATTQPPTPTPTVQTSNATPPPTATPWWWRWKMWR